jgi:hypothetical protein
MTTKKKKPANPHCPVRGCKTNQPHATDRNVAELVERFAQPDKALTWVHASLSELLDSMIDDYNSNRHLAWFTRMRQVEELYFRTLYIVFLIPDTEVPHWLSGDSPNSLSFFYNKVNNEILHGRGRLMDPNAELGLDRLIEFIHSGAHVDYRAMQHIARFGQAGRRPDNRYLNHVQTYIRYIDHVRALFEAGRDKQMVLQVIKNMHRQLEHWRRMAKEDATSPA